MKRIITLGSQNPSAQNLTNDHQPSPEIVHLREWNLVKGIAAFILLTGICAQILIYLYLPQNSHSEANIEYLFLVALVYIIGLFALSKLVFRVTTIQVDGEFIVTNSGFKTRRYPLRAIIEAYIDSYQTTDDSGFDVVRLKFNRRMRIDKKDNTDVFFGVVAQGRREDLVRVVGLINNAALSYRKDQIYKWQKRSNAIQSL